MQFYRLTVPVKLDMIVLADSREAAARQAEGMKSVVSSRLLPVGLNHEWGEPEVEEMPKREEVQR